MASHARRCRCCEDDKKTDPGLADDALCCVPYSIASWVQNYTFCGEKTLKIVIRQKLTDYPGASPRFIAAMAAYSILHSHNQIDAFQHTMLNMLRDAGIPEEKCVNMCDSDPWKGTMKPVND